MIRLLNLYPNHLNLNGDAGNLLILQRRAQWGGIAVELQTIEPGQALPAQRPDVVLVGHGSAAAWRQAYPALKLAAPTLEQWMLEGTAVIAISSGFAALHGLIPELPTQVSKVERVSNFVVESYEDQVLAGYKNTDLDLPNLLIDGNLIGSLLHGPVMAKSSWLADRILAKIVNERPELKEFRGELYAKRFSQAAVLAKAATELATEIASE
jgi:CobQ-like glutamine amidotransferase family enzyme